nr:hypothetical protein [Tanacetum cinerariifolium]
MKKMYCLVVTDDYSRFTWVFFLATKDETSGILKYFITGIENLVDHKVKIIRCDNRTDFKNKEMNQFCKKKIEEEVYVSQQPGFKDPDFSDRVYKVEKALYGLHQAPRAWHKGDILLVQVYVDDIIFGSTKKELCTTFENLMHKKFQMSSMGELTFFLGLQVNQNNDGIFISQDKYVAEILKKFEFTNVKTASTTKETQKPMLKDEDGEEVDVYMYISMIGSLMYMTSLRPDIMFAVCACARYQVNRKVSHLHDVKRIFRYLKGNLPQEVVNSLGVDSSHAMQDRTIQFTIGLRKKSIPNQSILGVMEMREKE